MDGWNAMLAHLHEHGRVGWIASGQINRVVGVTIDTGSAKLAHEIGSQWTTSGNVKSYSEGRTLVSTSLPGLGTLSAENRKVTGDPAWNYGKPEYQPGLIWSLITGQPITIDVSIGVGYVYENTFTIGRQAGN